QDDSYCWPLIRTPGAATGNEGGKQLKCDLPHRAFGQNRRMQEGQAERANGAERARQRAAVADELAREIKRRRLAADMSQRELATRIGYTRQYVSMTEWEDANLPSRELVAAIDIGLNADGALVAIHDRAKRDQKSARRKMARK